MRLNLRLADPESGRVDHVVVTAEPEAPLREVVRGLQDIQPGPLHVRGQALPEDGNLAGGALRDGDVVAVGRPGPGAGTGGRLELAAVGGPGAGRRWPLPSGTYVVGRAGEADIHLGHPSVSQHHLRLLVEDDLAAVQDLGSKNGTAVVGRLVDGPTLVRPGQVVQAGACLLEVRPAAPADADTSPDGEGGLAFNRPARIGRAAPEVRVTVPAAPSEVERYPFPWVQALLPVALAGAAAAAFFHRPEYMLFALMSPVLTVSNAMTGRRFGAKRSAREADRYRTELAEANQRMAEAAGAETARTRHEFPDPAGLGSIATGPGRRLWERREGDGDATRLRIGVVNRPAAITITARGGDAPPDPPELHAVPVTVDLAGAEVLGVAGPVESCRALARWLVAQLAVLRSPREVEIVILTEADADPDWEWVRFLPHVRSHDPAAPLAMIGNDKATRDERVRELVKLLDVRVAATRDLDGRVDAPMVVIVFDGVRALRSLPGVTRLLKEGPAVGILSIGLDRDANRLAEEGRAEVLLDAGEPVLGVLRVVGLDPVPGVLLDGVDPAWADEVARGLAPIRDIGGEGEAVIPDAVRFVDLAGIELDHVDDVVARWTLGGRTTEALVGASIDGPFTLDLRRDGPHALVAGTTGSGKSEFLQTLVVSLALANTPAAINFVLVDYKGASAFADCERLPHTVGLVTNLDSHLTQRALASLDAELERREQVLKDLGAADIDAAWSRSPERAAEAGLARLVLVIDEFAELVTELPDFVSGLIRIARVGRSLGVHLLLATQRPAGVVSAEMRANTGLRVALRMEDKNDSTEVLESPEAATISRSNPGRGYVRRGGGRGVVQFQTARVAGRRKGVTEGVPPPRVLLAPWKNLGYPAPPVPRSQERKATATDLFALVAMAREAAEKLGVPEPRRPWLPPLPEVVLLDDVGEPAEGLAPVPYGLEDLPALQAQRPARFDLVGGGHLVVAGSPRTGRSSALRTLATALARSVPPSDLHLYGLDFGNGALLPLAALPQCGAVVGRSETDRVERLVARLGVEVARRQQLMARFGFGDIAEQRAASGPDERLPYVVVMLDRWEGFLGQYPADSPSEVPAAFARLVREGLGAGLRFVVAGDRSILGDRLASLIDDKLVLRLADRNDLRLVNVNPRQAPEEMPAGRALRGESGLEVQFALLGADPSGASQAEALRRIGGEAARRWPEAERANRPFRVDALPSTIGFDEAFPLTERARTGASPLWALVGVGGDELAAAGIDLGAEGGGFVIAGPSRSGRSTAAVVMARSLLAAGAQLVAFCPRRSPLQQLAGAAGVVRVFSGLPAATEVSAALGQAGRPVVVVVDDAEAFARSEADDAVREFLRASTPGQAALIVAGQIEEMKNELRGAIVEARKGKAGLLLSPESTLDGELVALRLPRRLLGRTPPGRGVLALHGEPTVVQVPAI